MIKKIESPLSREIAKELRAGERVLISGVMYTAREAAHKRFVTAMDRGEPLPVALGGQSVYYAGPSPARPGGVIGSCGPTTSGRMDAYAPRLMDDAGLLVMIGKGDRAPSVIDSMKRNGCVYLAAIGGAAALISKTIEKAECVAYPDLGAEAVYRLEVRDFPAVVAIDSQGESVYRLSYSLA